MLQTGCPSASSYFAAYSIIESQPNQEPWDVMRFHDTFNFRTKFWQRIEATSYETKQVK
jgi:hypothetical protein